MERFLKIDKDFLDVRELTLPDGEVVKVSPTDKLIHGHMYDRWKFFTGSGSEYYDSLEDISKALAVHRNTVWRSVDKLNKLGLLAIEKKHIRGYESNVYTRVFLVGEKFKVKKETPAVKASVPESPDTDLENLSPF
ncbi:MAG TPA: HTH domain-containing protein [Tissierellaceae bacterium]|nr:HTH domain-containing protein [Tissierellaceae bacterium]